MPPCGGVDQWPTGSDSSAAGLERSILGPPYPGTCSGATIASRHEVPGGRGLHATLAPPWRRRSIGARRPGARLTSHPSPSVPHPRSRLALCAGVLAATLLVTACDHQRLVTQPELASESAHRPSASLLAPGCPRFASPPEASGQTNAGFMQIVNAACGPVLVYQEASPGVFHYSTVNPGQSTLVGGRACVTMSFDLPPSGGTCFNGPPSGELHPIPLYIYSGPVSPRSPLKRRRCIEGGEFNGCPAVIGVRG